MKCPYCQLSEEVWEKITERRAGFGPHHALVWEYIEKFDIRPITRNSKKTLRLLQEVATLFVQKKFTWKKVVYEISEKGIVEGLKVTCNADLVTPLKDHNYLRAVLAKIANDERAESRAALDKDLQRREEKARDRTDQSDQTDRTQEERTLSAKEIRERAGKLVSQIGARS